MSVLLFKNPTPRQIALVAASFVSAINLVLLLLIFFLIENSFQWWVLLVSSGVIFIATYQITLFALRRYIYRKIKVIYKTIFKLKRSKGEIKESLNLNNHIIDEVEKEVVNWARDQKEEIDELKNLESYRKNFLGNISHELKTPIFNIQGYLYTLLDGGMEDEKILHRYLNRAINNVERLNTIVQDLIAISQLESGELKLEMQRFDAHALCLEVFDDLEIAAKEKSISLKFKEGCNRSFFVYADRERVHQVLTNLIANSIKYGKAKGETKIGFYHMDKNILIEVSDNGIGIKEEHLSRLFERFYRVDKGRSRDQGGTGLGLSIVKHIIEAHNQTINVRSRDNMGSTFGFTLEKAH